MSHGFWNRFILVIAAVAMYGRSEYAQQTVQSYLITNPYHAVDSWGQLPEGRTWGSVSAISVDKKGNVWVGERCGKNDCSDSNLDSVLEFDSSGKIIRSFGGGM